tara:strand:+ start:8342 stop:8578 length:237 start_codon:yes stop_codon:yes gene_type:complete
MHLVGGKKTKATIALAVLTGGGYIGFRYGIQIGEWASQYLPRSRAFDEKLSSYRGVKQVEELDEFSKALRRKKMGSSN